MAISITTPANNEQLPGDYVILVTASTSGVADGDTVVWTSDAPSDVGFGHSENLVEAATSTTQVFNDESSVYMRWKNTAGESPAAGTKITATVSGTTDSSTSTYHFVLVQAGFTVYKTHANNPGNGAALDPNDTDTGIRMTVSTTNYLGNVPLQNWPVEFRTKRPEPKVWITGQTTFLPPEYDQEEFVYRLRTDVSGRVDVSIGSEEPVMPLVTASALGAPDDIQQIALVTLDHGNTMNAPSVTGDPVDLDSTGGRAFYAWLGSPPAWPSETVTAFVLSNTDHVPTGQILKFGTLNSFKQRTELSAIELAVDAPSQFQQNLLYYLAQRADGCYRSKVVRFDATGTKSNHPDYSITARPLGRPVVPNPVNYAAIQNGLRIRIPAYYGSTPSLCNPGDEVTIFMYLNAYVSGTIRPKFGYVTLVRGPANLTECQNGYDVFFDRTELIGFDESANGDYGQIEVEYQVKGNYGVNSVRLSQIFGYQPWGILGTVPPTP